MRERKFPLLVHCVFFLFAPLASLMAGNDSAHSIAKEITQDSLSQMLARPELFMKMRAAHTFPQGIVDTASGLASILGALEADLQNPISTDFHRGAYGSKADQLRRQYVFAITRLGPSIIPLLKSYRDTASVEMGDWVLVIMGFLEEHGIHDSLTAMIIKRDSNDKKALAVRALAQIDEVADTSFFMNLLEDAYVVTMKKDFRLPGGDFREDVYPVREEAASALRQQGFIVTRDENSVFTIKGRK